MVEIVLLHRSENLTYCPKCVSEEELLTLKKLK
jgi:hypothetical protein